jgi:hypothetical protein
VLARLYPLDRTRNADGLRRSLETIANSGSDEHVSEKRATIAPLLRQLLEDYSATGLPPAYLPQTTTHERLRMQARQGAAINKKEES